MRDKILIAKNFSYTYFIVMLWSDVAPAFEHDGSLRDIYILNTTIQDWKIVWDILNRSPERLKFRVDDSENIPPYDIEEIFSIRHEQTVGAIYHLDKGHISCCFFCPDLIELSLDPKDVDGPVDAEAIADFMLILGRAIAKEVRLTDENYTNAVIAVYNCARDEIIWLPVGPFAVA